MKKLLDSLYYQYVLDDEAKRAGTVFEDIEAVSAEEKILGLLAEHANRVALVVRMHEEMGSMVDELIGAALADEAVLEVADGEDDIVNAIQDTDEVTDLYDSFEQAEQSLLAFERKLAEAFTEE